MLLGWVTIILVMGLEAVMMAGLVPWTACRPFSPWGETKSIRSPRKSWATSYQITYRRAHIFYNKVLLSCSWTAVYAHLHEEFIHSVNLSKWAGTTTEEKKNIISHESVGLTPVFKSVVTTFFPGSPWMVVPFPVVFWTTMTFGLEVTGMVVIFVVVPVSR